jgi:rhodanese-related sulfurtransferase
MTSILHGTAALLALAAGALAAMAGNADPPLAPDEVAAVELAAWIRGREPNLVVLDLRDAEAFDRDRLPGAQRWPDAGAEAIAAAHTVVVYADTGANADVVRPSGATRVLRLRGGVKAWNDEVLFPVLRSDASARERRDVAARAALSRSFGGSPRLRDAGARAARSRSRRGC